MMIRREDDDDVDKMIEHAKHDDAKLDGAKTVSKSVIHKLPGKKTRITIGQGHQPVTEIQMVEPVTTGKKVVIKRAKPKADS